MEVSIRNQFNAVTVEQTPGCGQSEHSKLSLPRVPQTRFGSLQLGIVIAWVANEFPCALGDAAGYGLEQRFVESASHFNAERAIGGGETLGIDRLAKLSRETVQYLNFSHAGPEIWAGQKLT